MIPCKCAMPDCKAGLTIADDPPRIQVRDCYGYQLVTVYLDQTNISDLMLELRSLVNTMVNKKHE